MPGAREACWRRAKTEVEKIGGVETRGRSMREDFWSMGDVTEVFGEGMLHQHYFSTEQTMKLLFLTA